MNNVANNPNRRFTVPDKILLATDLEDADSLLPHAIAQARMSDAALTLAHAIPSVETLPLDASAICSADAVAMELEATRALEKMAARVRGVGVACDAVVRQGFPQKLIPELVKTSAADRLILGTHGRRHLKRLLLGSVTQEILTKVQVPVCTIGPHVQTGWANGKPLRILHPVSLRPGYEQSARLALEMAQFYQSEITLLHVLSRELEREHDSERVAEWSRSELQKLVPDEALLWTYVNAQIEVGAVVDHILNAANEMQADLIVLGTDASGAFWPIRGEGTAYEIIAQASCPVLTLRHNTGAEESKEHSKQELTNSTSLFAGMF
jgi:nucleotide-binding universal stress UspA family protein